VWQENRQTVLVLNSARLERPVAQAAATVHLSMSNHRERCWTQEIRPRSTFDFPFGFPLSFAFTYKHPLGGHLPTPILLSSRHSFSLFFSFVDDFWTP
jgi:hypothetical protein